MSTAFCYLLAFGSNLGDRDRAFDEALRLLSPHARFARASRRIETAPLPSTVYDVAHHEPYLNMVVEAFSPLAPSELYRCIVQVEDALGHPRDARWQPRHLDVDILACALVASDAGSSADSDSDSHSHTGAHAHARFEQGLPLLFSPVSGAPGGSGLRVPHVGFASRPFLHDLVVDDLEVPKACLELHGIRNDWARRMLQPSPLGSTPGALPLPLRTVFLGTPAVAARALELLLAREDLLAVVAVVSQPPARAARGTGTVPSPVHALASSRGIPVLTPDSAKDEGFLSHIEALAPDLCITAAYGNVLPEKFLALPRKGTLNIHPSLLPAYRGAAPVQRAVEEGLEETGVSVAFTVKAMDAGPIAKQVRHPIVGDVKAPELLARLFEVGAEALLSVIPAVAAGRLVPEEQDSARVPKARKMAVEEGVLRWSENAKVLHDRVRAFAGWPGTRATLLEGGTPQDVKIVTTRVVAAKPGSHAPRETIEPSGDVLIVVCDDGSSLGILELQPPGKRVLSARDFWNGLRTKDLRREARAPARPQEPE